MWDTGCINARAHLTVLMLDLRRSRARECLSPHMRMRTSHFTAEVIHIVVSHPLILGPV